MRIIAVAAFLFPLSLSLISCSSESGVGTGSGGQSATGGATAGTGGRGATGSGGDASGGASASGGAGGGGTASGGAAGNATASGGGGGQSGDEGTNGATGGAGGGVGGRGGGVGTGGSGDGGATTFNPCPAAGMECRIMPLGDSITLGSHSSGGGYRVELFRQSLMASQKITFVGRAAPNGPDTVTVNGTATPFPKEHEGYSGDTIDTNQATNNNGISAIVDAALTAGKPHIVLLMIGTNDVNSNIDLANAPKRLGNLLDQIITTAPNALLVVAKITPTKNDAGNSKVQTYNNAIPGLVQMRASAGKHIIMVDMYAAFTANASYKTAWLDDNLHPNDAGYVVMGQTWYAGIKSYLR